jgi:hypothetical protein
MLCALAFAPAALAAKGGASRPPAATSLALAAETITNSPNPAAPAWCLNEDDWHVRTWKGAIDGAFTTTERLCDGAADFSGGIWWDAGGIGLQADIVVAGTLSDLAITSPQGAGHHAVFVDSATSKGVTSSHYRVCYVPPFALASNTGGQSLAGGTWQVALAGSATQVSLTLRARMADVPFQQQYCPPSQQNFV